MQTYIITWLNEHHYIFDLYILFKVFVNIMRQKHWWFCAGRWGCKTFVYMLKIPIRFFFFFFQFLLGSFWGRSRLPPVMYTSYTFSGPTRNANTPICYNQYIKYISISILYWISKPLAKFSKYWEIPLAKSWFLEFIS